MKNDDHKIRHSGFSAEDTTQIYEIFNRTALTLAGQDASRKTIVRRMRMLATWLGESADLMAGISAEELAADDVADFWKRRMAGERGQ